MPSVLDRTVGFLADKLDRRGFLSKAAVVGSAAVVAPLEFGLRPTSAYAAVCNCSGSSCACGSTCCDGYTEFCCTLTGANACPPGTITAGWWKVDGSQFCGGAARYYLDCNAQCGTCGCGGNGVCGGECSGTGCGCAQGNCGNRKSGCTRFRYGQCNQGVACVGPIVCRVVTCAAPWSFDPACGTSSRTDEATRYHDRPCLDDPFGALEWATDVGGAIRVSGWAVANSDYGQAGTRLFLDTDFVYHGSADQPRPDVQWAYPAFGPNTGYDATITAPAGKRLVCAWGVDRRNGNTAMLGMREVIVQGPFGRLDAVQDVGDAIRLSGWAVANAANERAGIRIFLDTDFVYHGVAESPRPDIYGANPAYGPNTGFDVTINTTPGKHLVCAWGVDRKNGSLELLGTQEITIVGHAWGKLEVARNRGGGIANVSGWAVDPHTPGQLSVIRFLVDGTEVARAYPNVARPDVVASVPGANPNAGFDVDLVVGAGAHTICVEVQNTSGQFDSTGCLGVTVTG
jgi:hypothetical protein